MSLLEIRQATIHDPARNLDGLVTNLFVRDGIIISAEQARGIRPDRVLDARGLVVMPGGIDMHCHIVGPAVQAARQALLGSPRDKTTRQPVVPHARATGSLFAGMGYTTAIDAAIPGLCARQALEELADTPWIDRGYLSLMGNHRYIMTLLERGDTDGLRQYVGWSLAATRGYGVKIVNPGGVEHWKSISRKSLRELDAPVHGMQVTPRQIVTGLARAVDELGLPHAAHIHCNNLGYPGNHETTLHTMRALEGRRGHFAHIQFHSYGGNPDDPLSFCSAVDPLISYLTTHPEITVDIGHVTPGAACSITGDAPFAEHLARLSGGRWFTADVEQESSCGVIPGDFHPYKNLIHAVQWAISLEWYLKAPNPWQLAMTSDHPNGGAFTRYPEIIALLMSKNLRDEMWGKMPAALKERSSLPELTREYTLQEIAIITRAAPARILGLKQKGHLGPGADADLTLYSPSDDKRQMFQRPRYVIKAGEVIVEEGEFLVDHPDRSSFRGATHWTSTATIDSPPEDHREWFTKSYACHPDHYEIRAGETQGDLRLVGESLP